MATDLTSQKKKKSFYFRFSVTSSPYVLCWLLAAVTSFYVIYSNYTIIVHFMGLFIQFIHFSSLWLSYYLLYSINSYRIRLLNQSTQLSFKSLRHFWNGSFIADSVLWDSTSSFTVLSFIPVGSIIIYPWFLFN